MRKVTTSCAVDNGSSLSCSNLSPNRTRKLQIARKNIEHCSGIRHAALSPCSPWWCVYETRSVVAHALAAAPSSKRVTDRFPTVYRLGKIPPSAPTLLLHLAFHLPSTRDRHRSPCSFMSYPPPAQYLSQTSLSQPLSYRSSRKLPSYVPVYEPCSRRTGGAEMQRKVGVIGLGSSR